MEYAMLPLAFACVILAGFEVLARLVVPVMGNVLTRTMQDKSRRSVPVQSSHHDKFDAVDWLCVTFSRCITVPFVYHLLVYCCVSPCVLWPGGAGGNNDNFPQNMPAALFTADGFVVANAAIVEFLAENVIAGNATKVVTAGATKTAWDANLGKTTSAIVHYAVSVILMYVTYDFFYYWFHRTLHLRSLYKFVHKHHHRQHAPSRGNLDAINVHPFEFICGEYNHLLAVSLVGNGMRAAGLGGVPIGAILTFVVLGGALASLNHTRFNVRFGAFSRLYSFAHPKKGGATPAYEVAAHDVHHRLPTKNYGQYLMIYDMMFGSYERLVDKTSSSKSM